MQISTLTLKTENTMWTCGLSLQTDGQKSEALVFSKWCMINSTLRAVRNALKDLILKNFISVGKRSEPSSTSYSVMMAGASRPITSGQMKEELFSLVKWSVRLKNRCLVLEYKMFESYISLTKIVRTLNCHAINVWSILRESLMDGICMQTQIWHIHF